MRLRSPIVLFVLLFSTAPMKPALAEKHIDSGDRVIGRNRLISSHSLPGRQLCQAQLMAEAGMTLLEPERMTGKPDWKGAQVFAPFIDQSGRPEPGTEVKAAYDRDGIHLLWNIAQNTLPAGNVAVEDSALVGDDYVQVDLRPVLPDSIKYARDYYYSVAVNAKGTLWDAYFDPYDDGYFFSSWDSQARVSASRNGNNWSVEMSIPFAGLDCYSDKGWKWQLFFYRGHAGGQPGITHTRTAAVAEQGADVRRPALVNYYWDRPEVLNYPHPDISRIPLPKAGACRLTSGPAKDGRENGDLWKNADLIQLDYIDDSTARVKQAAARGRVGFDDENLYFLLEADGAAPKKLETVTGTGMNSQLAGLNGIYRNVALDRVEAFRILLQPRRPGWSPYHQDFYFISVDNAGNVFSIRYDRQGFPDRNWKPEAVIDSFQSASGWGMELTIPIRDFNLPPGCASTWGFNLMRNRLLSDGQAELQAWYPTLIHDRDPGLLGGLSGLGMDKKAVIDRKLENRAATLKKTLSGLENIPASKKDALLGEVDRQGKGPDPLKVFRGLEAIDGRIGALEETSEMAAKRQPAWQGYCLYDIYFANRQQGWAVGGMGAILHTTDGGRTWERQSSGTDCDLKRVLFVGDSEGWIVGGRPRMATSNREMRHDEKGGAGIILHTVDGGRNWEIQHAKRARYLLGLTFIDSRNGWISGEAGTLLRTEDGGLNWYPLPTTGNLKWLYGIKFFDRDRGIVAGEDATVMLTKDGGLSWKKVQAEPDRRFYEFRPFYEDVFFQGSRGWIVGDNGTIITSADNGETWEPQTVGLSGEIRELFDLSRVYFTGPEKGWAVGGLGTRILVTSDGGKNWRLQEVPNRDWLRGIFMVDDTHGFAVGEREKIVSTADGGNSWARVRGDDANSDMLLGMAHGDDGGITLGTLVAYYALKEGKSVAHAEFTRDSHSTEYQGRIYNREGQRNLNLIGSKVAINFEEFDTGNEGVDMLHFTERLWHGREPMERHMAAFIRAYRPNIIITHDPVFGEYNKPGHRATGRTCFAVFESAGGPDQWPELTRLGLTPWQPKKLYCFDSETYPSTIDLGWMEPVIIESTGMSCKDWADYALRCFLSQGVHRVSYPHLSLVKSLVKTPDKEKSIFDGLK